MWDIIVILFLFFGAEFHHLETKKMALQVLQKIFWKKKCCKEPNFEDFFLKFLYLDNRSSVTNTYIERILIF
jgi:hypothetical protein